MRVLVTGGAGYLGSHLVRLLIERGHQVRVFDRFCFGERTASDFGSDSSCEIVHGDIRRLAEFPKLLDGVEGVIHLAGLANDPSCDLDPEMAIDVNLNSTRVLANLAVQRGVRRFVKASSCSVYGKGVFDVLDEESPTNPVSVYAETKLESEHFLLPLKSDTFEPVLARPATLFGWSSRMRFDLAINLMVATASRQKCINVFGGGNQWRPFVHVRDAARAFAMLLEAPPEKVSGEVFNLGSDGSNYRIIDLAKTIVAMFDNVHLDVANDDEDQRSYNVQFGKIRRTIGFEHEWSVEAGAREIRERLEDLRINPFDPIYFNVRRMKQLMRVPVSDGGEAVSARFIALAPPNIGDAEIAAVEKVLRSDSLSDGSVVQDFEREFAKVVGAPHAVAVSSCTAGLHVCLVQAGVGPGDEVIVSPLTWPTTINSIVNMGAKPVPADIDPDTLNVDPKSVARAITKRTKAIMPVHLAGQPCDLDAIYAVAKKHGIPVIEDAAHALGATYKGKSIGNYGAATCFSFRPVKMITSLEGGMITVQDEAVAREFRLLANNGIRSSAPGLSPMVREFVRAGFNYGLSSFNAAIGMAQLDKLDTFLAARRRLARIYYTFLPEIDEITLPAQIPGVVHAWQVLIVRLRLDRLKKTRDEIAELLRQENVGTGVHYPSVHRQPFYREYLGLTDADLPNASAASDSILSLPLHPRLTDKHLGDVIEALKKVIAYAKK